MDVHVIRWIPYYETCCSSGKDLVSYLTFCSVICQLRREGYCYYYCMYYIYIFVGQKEKAGSSSPLKTTPPSSPSLVNGIDDVRLTINSSECTGILALLEDEGLCDIGTNHVLYFAIFHKNILATFRRITSFNDLMLWNHRKRLLVM